MRFEQSERGVLDALRVPFTAAPLLVGAFACVELASGRASPWLFFHALSSVATASLLWWRHGPMSVRRVGAVAGLTFSAGCVLFHYGPLFGSGVFFMSATLAAAFFTGRRGTGLTIVSLLLLVVLAAWGCRAGWLSPQYALPTTLAWVRLGLGATFTLAVCGYLFDRVQQLRGKALQAELTARSSQEEAQREREQLLERSMVAQRLEGLGRLAGGVAHDLNNALMGIGPNVELLRSSKSLSAEHQMLLGEISTAAKRADSTCKALLAFASPRPEDAGTCAPADVLRRFETSVGRLLTKKIALSVEASDNTPHVGLSGRTLEQLLMNLALNARDAMPEGGMLHLSCSRELGTGRAAIEVRDNGVGMSDEVRQRVFEPFFTTKDRATGMGLPMVWGVVTRAGGTVEVISQLGKGTRVLLSLAPAEVAIIRPSPPPPQALISAEPGRQRPRVLLMDDDLLVQRALARILKHGGYEVKAFDRARPAQEAVATEHFDALVTDAMVPEGGVPSLIEAFRQRHPDSVILVCSGHVAEEMVSLGIVRGDFRFVRKPVEMDEFLALLAAPLRSAERAS